jgi:hypothetical protein
MGLDLPPPYRVFPLPRLAIRVRGAAAQQQQRPPLNLHPADGGGAGEYQGGPALQASSGEYQGPGRRVPWKRASSHPRRRRVSGRRRVSYCEGPPSHPRHPYGRRWDRGGAEHKAIGIHMEGRHPGKGRNAIRSSILREEALFQGTRVSWWSILAVPKTHCAYPRILVRHPGRWSLVDPWYRHPRIPGTSILVSLVPASSYPWYRHPRIPGTGILVSLVTSDLSSATYKDVMLDITIQTRTTALYYTLVTFI